MALPPRFANVLALFAIAASAACPASAIADEPCAPLAVREWDPTPAALARDLLLRARALDDAALTDERLAVQLANDVPAKRVAAKVARELADRARGDDKAALDARAEDLEADIVISEAETLARRQAAAERRRSARELRARALRLVQGGSAELARPDLRARQSDIF